MLAATGAAGLGAVQPITWVILLLPAILCVSYWQTIAAYSNNGGSYIVARENLGERAGLLAASALMVDYMLNVAVGIISAGVGALTSAVPALHPATLPLCLGVLAVLTLLAAFGGITDQLFAVSAFLRFTLSQAGMSVHWRRHGSSVADRTRLLVIRGGAVATGLALAIILIAKFAGGAWLTPMVIPLALGVLLLVHRYYKALHNQVLGGSNRHTDLASHAPPSAIVTIERWDRMPRHAVQMAVRLSPNVVRPPRPPACSFPNSAS